MLPPKFYEVEGKAYPRLILGGDRFVGIFPKPRPPELLEEPYIFEVMNAAWNHGVGGFDLNTMSENILSAFVRLKDKFGSAVVGIGDPNWKCGYMLHGQHLMDIKARIIRTLVERLLDDHSKFLIASLSEKSRRCWFDINPQSEHLSDTEINDIYIDEDTWLKRLRKICDFADFCLFGADYADWMLLLGREDLLLWQIDTIRAHGMIPISVCHWTSLSLPKLEKLPIAVHWTLGNLEAMYLSTLEAIKVISATRKPVTCFRVLRGISIPDEINKAVEWLHLQVGAQSLVIGVDSIQQANETFSIAYPIMNTTHKGGLV
jgi:hypothetical protein